MCWGPLVVPGPLFDNHFHKCVGRSLLNIFYIVLSKGGKKHEVNKWCRIFIIWLTFLLGNIHTVHKSTLPISFLPLFRFAYTVAAVLLSTLVRRLRLHRVEGQVVEARYELVTTPKDDTWITVSKRNWTTLFSHPWKLLLGNVNYTWTMACAPHCVGRQLINATSFRNSPGY